MPQTVDKEFSIDEWLLSDESITTLSTPGREGKLTFSVFKELDGEGYHLYVQNPFLPFHVFWFGNFTPKEKFLFLYGFSEECREMNIAEEWATNFILNLTTKFSCTKIAGYTYKHIYSKRFNKENIEKYCDIVQNKLYDLIENDEETKETVQRIQNVGYHYYPDSAVLKLFFKDYPLDNTKKDYQQIPLNILLNMEDFYWNGMFAGRINLVYQSKEKTFDAGCTKPVFNFVEHIIHNNDYALVRTIIESSKTISTLKQLYAQEQNNTLPSQLKGMKLLYNILEDFQEKEKAKTVTLTINNGVSEIKIKEKVEDLLYGFINYYIISNGKDRVRFAQTSNGKHGIYNLKKERKFQDANWDGQTPFSWLRTITYRNKTIYENNEPIQ